MDIRKIEPSEWVKIFEETKEFDSKEEMFDWVRKKGKDNKIVVVTVRSDVKTKGENSKLVMACDRCGTYKAKEKGDSNKNAGTKKCGCPFRVKSKCTNGKWTVQVTCAFHNHPLVKYNKGHAYFSRLKKDDRERVHDMLKVGVKPKVVLSLIKEKDPENESTQTIYNDEKKIDRDEMKDRNQLQHLMALATENQYLVYTRSDAENVLISLWWSSPDSVDLLRSFPYVLMMDSTYKTNIFDYPLLEVVGVTSILKTFPVCYCAMKREDTENFTWALDCINRLGDIHPLTIITDRAFALIGAVENVFPGSRHLLCRWHIKMAVNAKIREYLPMEEGELMKKSMGDLSLKRKKKRSKVKNDPLEMRGLKGECAGMWQKVVYSKSETEFERYWGEMKNAFAEFPKLLEYIQTTWLVHKEKFVAAWTDTTLHFGNTSTNRVESAHNALKGNLNNNRLQNFLSMWSLIHSNWALSVATIKASFETSVQRVRHEHRIAIFDNLRGYVSAESLDIMKKEYVELCKIDFNNSRSCCLDTSFGLSCAHVMKVVLSTRFDKKLYLSDIHVFWKTLALKVRFTNVTTPPG